MLKDYINERNHIAMIKIVIIYYPTL